MVLKNTMMDMDMNPIWTRPLQDRCTPSVARPLQTVAKGNILPILYLNNHRCIATLMQQLPLRCIKGIYNIPYATENGRERRNLKWI